MNVDKEIKSLKRRVSALSVGLLFTVVSLIQLGGKVEGWW